MQQSPLTTDLTAPVRPDNRAAVSDFLRAVLYTHVRQAGGDVRRGLLERSRVPEQVTRGGGEDAGGEDHSFAADARAAGCDGLPGVSRGSGYPAGGA